MKRKGDSTADMIDGLEIVGQLNGYYMLCEWSGREGDSRAG